MKTYSKTLYYKEYNFPIGYKQSTLMMDGYIKFEMHFDFKEGLRFSVSVPDFVCCRRNPFEALFIALEKQSVGNGKYQILKEDCRNQGFWKQLK